MTQALVLTVIGATPGALSASLLARLRADINGLWTIAYENELAPNEAHDFFLAGQAEPEAFTAFRDRLVDAPCDIILQAAAGRRKNLLVADMESTIIENEMLDELAEIAGIGEHIAKITRRAMNGELDFEAALKERVALLKGLPMAALDESWARVRLIPGADELVSTMRADGAYCCLVSGGFTVYTELVGHWLGFHHHQANRLKITDNALSGIVEEPILGRAAKLDALLSYATARKLDPAQALAVGDGANDLAMLTGAGLGIAFHAKPSVRTQAQHRIDHADLRALLFAQGYRLHDIKKGGLPKPVWQTALT